jgi:hypothetical protein
MLSLSKREGVARVNHQGHKGHQGFSARRQLGVLVFLVVNPFPVIPAKAGIQSRWTPAFAGVTD